MDEQTDYRSLLISSSYCYTFDSIVLQWVTTNGRLGISYIDSHQYKFFGGKLQLINPWFDWNLSCLHLVWNLTLYPPKISSVRFTWPNSIKNRVKYVILLHFCVFLLQKHKKIKIQDQITSKRIKRDTCIMKFQNHG